MRALLFVLALCAAPAHAQVQFGFGGDDPIAVKAETATYQGGLTILETDVVARQSDTVVMADRMDIYREQRDSDNSIAGSIRLGALKRIEARGNFRFENPENTVTGDLGIYYADRDIFIVTGDVELTQPSGSSVRGKRLVYDLNTRSARFGTACQTGVTEDGRDAAPCERVTFELK